MKHVAFWVAFPFVLLTRYFKAFVAMILLFALMGFSAKSLENLEGNLAEIKLMGMILDSRGLVKQIENLREDSSIAGVLLVVDSPGGALSPSVEIYEELKRLAAKKPLVVYAQGTLASGSYYAALGAQHIIANKGAIIGSIGVIFEGIDVSELIAKLGIRPQVLKAGQLKEAGTIMRAWNDEERNEIEELLMRQYDMFVTDVCTARRIDCAQKESFAEGRIFDSARALKLGLIDSIGTKNDAKKELIALSGVEFAQWVELKESNILWNTLQSSLHAFVWNLFGIMGR
ncbi:MAG: signal peptide peptidase SppA [Helicobacter sp.]|nr:signal peptide peptidase SppA [Helicobacter sp.]